MKKIITKASVLITLAALMSGCAAMRQIAANNRLQQYEVRCYRERGYPDLVAQDGCTDRDIFNGQQIQAQWNAEAAQAAASEAQEQANLRAQQAADERTEAALLQGNHSMNCTTTYIGSQAYTNCN